jgi:hypothetical protein
MHGKNDFTMAAPMTRSLRSPSSSHCGNLKRTAEEPLTRSTKKCPTAREEIMDPMLNLLVHIFDGIDRGVWVRILPNDDTIDDLCTATNQKWEDLLPLLIKTGLINCKVAEDVRS